MRLVILISIIPFFLYSQTITNEEKKTVDYLFSQKSIINTFDTSFLSIETFQKYPDYTKRIIFYFYNPVSNQCNSGENQIFFDSTIYSLIRDNFLFVKSSSKSKITKDYVKAYKVTNYSTILIVDSNLKELHRLTRISRDNVKRHLTDFLFKDKNLKLYKEKFHNGERGANFLLEFSYLLYDASQLDTSIIKLCLKTFNDSNLSASDYIAYLHRFIYFKFIPIVLVDHSAFKYYYDNQKDVLKFFPIEQVKSNIIWIAIASANDAIKIKSLNLFNQSSQILINENYKLYKYYVNDGGDSSGLISNPDILLFLKIKFYNATFEKKLLNLSLKEVKVKFINDWEALNEFAWEIYQGAYSKKVNKIAMDWVKRSIEINRNSYNLDTYAALLYKAEKYDRALIFAEEAVLISKKNGAKPNDSTLKLIRQIKTKI